MTKPSVRVDEDFEYLQTFLPAGWQVKAKELGAMRRCRRIPDAQVLLRILLIHLAEGCSLRETAVRVRHGGIADVSDVAIMDRLRLAGKWFSWMNRELMAAWIPRRPVAVFGDRWRIRLVDGTRVKEPGPTGSSWCVHYAVDLPSLSCRELIVTDSTGNGETLARYTVEPGDLFVGDRVYGSPPSVAHALEPGGDVLVRLAWSQLPLWSPDGTRFDLLAHLKSLRGTRLGDWDVVVRHEGRQWNGRVCALRRSRQAAQRELQRIRRRQQKSGGEIQPETIEAAHYVFVFTSAQRNQLTAGQALEMYRGRWQVELVFKRLKSLLGLGHLKKRDVEAARSWLEGKLFVALLTEALIRCGESLSPWGYQLQEAEPSEKSVSLA